MECSGTDLLSAGYICLRSRGYLFQPGPQFPSRIQVLRFWLRSTSSQFSVPQISLLPGGLLLYAWKKVLPVLLVAFYLYLFRSKAIRFLHVASCSWLFFCSCFLCPASFPSIWEFPLPGSLPCIYSSSFFCTPHIFSLCFRFPLRNIPLRFLTRAPEFTTREFNPEADWQCTIYGSLLKGH